MSCMARGGGPVCKEPAPLRPPSSSAQMLCPLVFEAVVTLRERSQNTASACLSSLMAASPRSDCRWACEERRSAPLALAIWSAISCRTQRGPAACALSPHHHLRMEGTPAERPGIAEPAST
eukprot:scaffold29320_cov35-Tisochrysis_lutea.AAC.1